MENPRIVRCGPLRGVRTPRTDHSRPTPRNRASSRTKRTCSPPDVRSWHEESTRPGHTGPYPKRPSRLDHCTDGIPRQQRVEHGSQHCSPDVRNPGPSRGVQRCRYSEVGTVHVGRAPREGTIERRMPERGSGTSRRNPFASTRAGRLHLASGPTGGTNHGTSAQTRSLRVKRRTTASVGGTSGSIWEARCVQWRVGSLSSLRSDGHEGSRRHGSRPAAPGSGFVRTVP